MSKKNFPAYEPLDDQLRMLKDDISAEGALKTTVVNGTADGIKIPPRVHVKQTAKAILLYAVCVALFLGAVMMLPGLFNEQPPVAATQDTLTRPHLSESEKALYHAAWAALKDTVPEDYTINDLLFPGVWIQCGDAFICSSYKWEQTKDQTVGIFYSSLTVAGYYFKYGEQFTVFANDRAYKLHFAYARKMVSADDVAAFYEVYKEKHPNLAYLTNEFGKPEIGRDTITNPELLTNIQLEITLATWEVNRGFIYNNSAFDHYTIDVVANHMRSCFLYPCGNGYALHAYEFVPAGMMLTDEIIGDYKFRYNTTDTLDYYENGEFFTLAEAYAQGKVSEENLRKVWEHHKSNNFWLYNRVEHTLTYPYVYDSIDPNYDLGELLKNKTCVNTLIDKSTLHATQQFKPDDPNTTGVASLFDSVKTEEDYTAAGSGVLLGEIGEFTCFLFDMKEAVKISAYVITSGSDNHFRTDRNPVAWHLYATNDAAAAAAMRGEYANYERHITSNSKWVDLDYVWDGGMYAEDFYENGYVVDAEKQGEYRYYCWVIEYTGGGEMEVAELELYVNRSTVITPCQHDYQITNGKPSCTNRYTLRYTCTKCNRTKQESFDPQGHSYTSGVCINCKHKDLRLLSGDEIMDLIKLHGCPEDLLAYGFDAAVTEEERLAVEHFLVNTDAKYVFSEINNRIFYSPYEVDPYTILYNVPFTERPTAEEYEEYYRYHNINIEEEHPVINLEHKMSPQEISDYLRTYLGIEFTKQMQEDLKTKCTYLEKYNAYYISATDFAGNYPFSLPKAYKTADGRILAIASQTAPDKVNEYTDFSWVVLLTPHGDSYHISMSVELYSTLSDIANSATQ